MTGADFSPRGVELARSLAVELNLPRALEDTFDVVYTSRGVLGWLPDLEPWARVIAHFLRRGGVFYISEIHPFTYVFDDTVGTTDLEVRFSYFPRPEPVALPVKGSYANPSATVETKVEYTWPHSMAEVVTSLAAAGLHIDFLHEWPWLDWELPYLVPRADGNWGLPPERDGEIPLSFSLRATRTGA